MTFWEKITMKSRLIEIDPESQVIPVNNIFEGFMRKISGKFDKNGTENIDYIELYRYFLEEMEDISPLALAVFEGVNYLFRKYLSDLPARFGVSSLECMCGYDRLADISGDMRRFVAEKKSDIEKCPRHEVIV